MSNAIEFSIRALDDFTATMNKAEGSLASIANTFKAAAAAAGVYAAVRVARASLDNAEAMGLTAQKAGMTVEAFSALAYAAKMSNVETSSLTTGIKFLSRAMSENGAPEAQKALQALGISTKDPQQALMQLADQFAKSKDGAEKTSAAMAIFGRSGTDMIPMLNQGSTGLRSMSAEAKQLGQVISSNFSPAADEINDNLARMGAVASGVVNTAMEALAPTIEKLSADFVTFAKDSGIIEIAIGVLTTGLKLLVTVAVTAESAFASLFRVVGTSIAAAVALITDGPKAAMEIMTKGVSDASSKMADSMSLISDMWDESATSTSAAEKKRSDALRASGAEIARHNTATEESAKAAVKLQEDIKNSVAELEKEAATYGLSATQVKMYELALLGASDAQIALAANAANSIEAQERQAEATSRLKEVMGEYAPGGTEIERYEADRATALEYAALEGADAEQAALMLENIEMAHRERMIALARNGMLSQQQIAKIDAQTQVAIVASKFSAMLGVAAGHSKTAFELKKAADLAHAAMMIPSTAVDAYAFGTKFGGPPLGAAMAAIAVAAQVANMAAIASAKFGGAAHGGLDYVPSESTYLLDKGERVLSPRQNQDLTAFMSGGGNGGSVTVQNLSIHVLENAIATDAFARMNRTELREKLGQPIIDALDEMWKMGTRPAFARGGT